MTLLPVEAVYAHFHLALLIGAEDEAVTLVCLYHVVKLGRKDIVAAILALFLPCQRVNVLDRQVLVKCLRVELTLSRLASLEVDNGRDFYITPLLLCLVRLHGVHLLLPAFRVALFPRVFVGVGDGSLMDQNIDVGEELDFAATTEVGRSRLNTLIFYGVHTASDDRL